MLVSFSRGPCRADTVAFSYWTKPPAFFNSDTDTAGAPNLDDESLQLLEDHQRVDTNYIDLYAKVALNPDRSSKEQITDLREFISGAKRAGRTEVLPLGDIGPSIIGPERCRYEIIEKIAAENAKVSEAMKAECDITIGGLEGRVQWERTAVSELTLYIPYGMEVSGCSS